MKRKKVLFLYSELAGYFLSCIKSLIGICDAINQNIEVHIIKYPVNKEAPFQFSEIERTFFYDRNDYTIKQLLKLAQTIQPDSIITGMLRLSNVLQVLLVRFFCFGDFLMHGCRASHNDYMPQS